MSGSGNIIVGKIELLLRQGRELIEADQLDEAMTQLTEVLLHDKKNPIALRYLDRIWASKRGEVKLPREGGPPLEVGTGPHTRPAAEPAPAEEPPPTEPAAPEPTPAAEAKAEGATAGSAGAAAWSWPGQASGEAPAPGPARAAEAAGAGLATSAEQATGADTAAASELSAVEPPHPSRPQTLPEEAILGPAEAQPPAEPEARAEPPTSRFQPLEMDGVLVCEMAPDEISALDLDPIADYALRLVDGEMSVRQLADKCLLDPDNALSLFQDLAFRGAVRIR